MPELSRLLSTWSVIFSTLSVILSTYDIRYVLRNAMKAQGLADFFAEMTPVLETLKPTTDVW